MTTLTERQEKLSQYLIKARRPVEVTELAYALGISKRSVYYDLKCIEGWAKAVGMGFYRFPRQGIVLARPDQALATPSIASINPPEKRREIILLKLLLCSDIMAAEELSNGLGLSRNTILMDIKEIRSCSLPPQVELIGLRSHGYAIRGDENAIRDLISHLIFSNILNYDLISFLIKNKRRPEADPFLDVIADQLEMLDVKQALKAASKQYDFWLPDSDYVRFIIFQAITLHRMRLGKTLRADGEHETVLEEYEEIEIARMVLAHLADQFSIEVPEAEVINTFRTLLTCNIKTRSKIMHLDSVDDLLTGTVRRMIDEIVPYTSINGKAYHKLEHDLIEHLKLTIKQLKLDVVGDNPLLDTIKVTYSQSFLMAEKMAAIFEDAMGMRLPESEVGYLALHIAVYFEVTGKVTDQTTVVVICNGGKGAANILSKKLRVHLPDLKIKGTYSILDLEEKPMLLKDVDLIISTINYVNSQKPVLTISPLLSDQEISILKEFIWNRESLKVGEASDRMDDRMFDTLYSRLEKRMDKESVKIFKEELESAGVFWDDKFVLGNPLEGDELGQSGITAMVVLEAMDMLKTLNGINLSLSNDKSVGLLIHLIMAIGRWQKGIYASEPDMAEFQKKAPEIWAIVVEFLKRSQRHIKHEIPESECVSIMRYLI